MRKLQKSESFSEEKLGEGSKKRFLEKNTKIFDQNNFPWLFFRSRSQVLPGALTTEVKFGHFLITRSKIGQILLHFTNFISNTHYAETNQMHNRSPFRHDAKSIFQYFPKFAKL